MSLNESAEITALLRESTLTGPSSTQLGWSGVAVERRTIQPCEKPELPIDHHFLLLWLDPVSEGEIERKPGRFVPYKKVQRTISTFLPGLRPATPGFTTHRVLISAISPPSLRQPPPD